MKRLLALSCLTVAAAALADPSGHRWFDSNTTPIKYRVFTHDTINGLPNGAFPSRVLPAINRGFSAWPAVMCSGGKTTWNVTFAGQFSSPVGTAAINANDNCNPSCAAVSDRNHVVWMPGSQWRYPSATLGITSVTYLTNGQIVDADMEMNDNVIWFDDQIPAAQQATRYDYESVLIHEAGHFAGLNHSPGAQTVMFATVANGSKKRALTTYDATDICTVYPGTTSGGQTQGGPCNLQTDCAGGLVCRAPSGGTNKICTVDCSANPNACPTGYVCQGDAMGGTSRACFPPAGAADYCKFCVTGTDCSSGLCLRDVAGHNWCSNTCTPATGCAPGASCIDVQTEGNCTGTNSCVCVPPSYKCTGQCTGTGACSAIGYACNNTTCEATGNVGDRCEVSEYCKSCGVCVGDPSAAYCRACCNNGSPYCTGCTNGSCTAYPGQACTGITNTSVSVCYPVGGAALCQACDGATACNDGAACLAGRCHASCNPAAPGACQACLDQGGGSGVCACENEQASEGERCGVVSASQFYACRTPLVCVSVGGAGGVTTCRAKCNPLGSASECPTGQMCSSVGACVPATAGAICTACSNGTCATGSTCIQGRCRGMCNPQVNGVCDGRCVDVGGGQGVCACDDELKGSGQACGAQPTIAACQPSLTCLQGFCSASCDPMATNTGCPLGTECKAIAGSSPPLFQCQIPDPIGGAGGGTAGTGGGSGRGGGTAGTGGGMTNYQGCGCGALPGDLAWSALLLLGTVARRRFRS